MITTTISQRKILKKIFLEGGGRGEGIDTTNYKHI